MYFFTSDTHFNDLKSLEFDFRPFKSPKQFDRYVIKTWNKQAKKSDTIFVIGDFVDCDGAGFDGWKKALTYVKKIKAQVILLMGNNEDRVVRYYFDNDYEKFRAYCLALGFKDVQKDMTITFNGQEFFLTHKPVHYKKGMFNLFGHTHRSGGLYKPFGLNVGCDLNHFRLYSESDIEYLMAMKQKYWDDDRNLNMKLD